MDLPGRLVTRTRTLRTDDLIVEFDVPAIVPDEDPSEPVFAPEVVAFLREAEQRLRAGDLAWLRAHGRVYRRERRDSVA